MFMGFKLYVEDSDPFGFEELDKSRDAKDNPGDFQDDLPIVLFSIQWLMDSLSRKKLNNVKATADFLDEVYWGKKQAGTIRVRLTPNTNIYIERLMFDLTGASVWVCKSLFKIDQREFRGKEDVVANDIFKEVVRIDSENLEAAKKEYDLQPLLNRLVSRIRTTHGSVFMYQDVKRVRKNYYVIWFSIVGSGTGKLLHGRRTARSPEATIDIAYDDIGGMIHIILTTISGGGEGLSWEIDIPYMDAHFAPTQAKEEIVSSVVTALKYY